MNYSAAEPGVYFHYHYCYLGIENVVVQHHYDDVDAVVVVDDDAVEQLADVVVVAVAAADGDDDTAVVVDDDDTDQTSSLYCLHNPFWNGKLVSNLILSLNLSFMVQFYTVVQKHLCFFWTRL